MSTPLPSYKCRVCGTQMEPGQGNICSRRCRADEHELSDADLHDDRDDNERTSDLGEEDSEE